MKKEKDISRHLLNPFAIFMLVAGCTIGSIGIDFITFVTLLNSVISGFIYYVIAILILEIVS